MEVKIKKLHPDAKMPTQGTSGAACFDLYAVEDFDDIAWAYLDIPSWWVRKEDKE